MGDWNSLHLLDEASYESETLRILANVDLLRPHYAAYEKRCLGGKCAWPIEAIIQTTKLNADIFRQIRAIEEEAFGEKEWNLPNNLGDYHFRRFLRFLIFRTSAQFFPYFRMGKSYLWHAIDLPEDSLVAEILDHIFMAFGPFNNDGDGIRKIISREDLSLLISDVNNIRAKTTEDQDLIDEFIYFLKFAEQKGLGLLSGQNLEDNLLINDRIQLDKLLREDMEFVIYNFTD